MEEPFEAARAKFRSRHRHRAHHLAPNREFSRHVDTLPTTDQLTLRIVTLFNPNPKVPLKLREGKRNIHLHEDCISRQDCLSYNTGLESFKFDESVLIF